MEQVPGGPARWTSAALYSPIYIGTKRARLCAAAQPARHRGNRGGKGLALKVLTGDTVQFFNRVRRQLQASASYILSQMLDR